MSTVFADVQITTDKEFYRPNDPILVSVRGGGYVILPYVSKISFGTYLKTQPPNMRTSDFTLSVPPDQHRGNLIEVDFHPEIVPWELRRFHEVKVVDVE